MPARVLWSKTVSKQLLTLPFYIKDKFFSWVLKVDLIGILETRKWTSYHDEPLKGRLAGQRSVRLSRSYRVIYIELSINKETIINVISVTKHKY